MKLSLLKQMYAAVGALSAGKPPTSNQKCFEDYLKGLGDEERDLSYADFYSSLNDRERAGFTEKFFSSQGVFSGFMSSFKAYDSASVRAASAAAPVPAPTARPPVTPSVAIPPARAILASPLTVPTSLAELEAASARDPLRSAALEFCRARFSEMEAYKEKIKSSVGAGARHHVFDNADHPFWTYEGTTSDDFFSFLKACEKNIDEYKAVYPERYCFLAQEFLAKEAPFSSEFFSDFVAYYMANLLLKAEVIPIDPHELANRLALHYNKRKQKYIETGRFSRRCISLNSLVQVSSCLVEAATQLDRPITAPGKKDLKAAEFKLNQLQRIEVYDSSLFDAMENGKNVVLANKYLLGREDVCVIFKEEAFGAYVPKMNYLQIKIGGFYCKISVNKYSVVEEFSLESINPVTAELKLVWEYVKAPAGFIYAKDLLPFDFTGVIRPIGDEFKTTKKYEAAAHQMRAFLKALFSGRASIEARPKLEEDLRKGSKLPRLKLTEFDKAYTVADMEAVIGAAGAQQVSEAKRSTASSTRALVDGHAESKTDERGSLLYCAAQEEGGRGVQEDRFGLASMALKGAAVLAGNAHLPKLAQALATAIGNTAAALPLSEAGSTLVTALCVKHKIVVANLGDSRAILLERKKDGTVVATRLSQDHKPTLASERARIEREGGRVSGGRLNGNLALSRGLGDDNEAGFSNQPELSCYEVDPESEAYLCLVSDGIPDALTDQEMADFVFTKPKDKRQEALLELLGHASKKGSSDNKTMLLIPVGTKDDEIRAAFVADGHGGSEISQGIQETLMGELRVAIGEAYQKATRVAEDVSLTNTLYSAGKAGAFLSEPGATPAAAAGAGAGASGGGFGIAPR